VPLDCHHRLTHGSDACLTTCPATAEEGGCRLVRVDRDNDPPPADPSIIDVAVLDMHHGWPNLGHDSIVHAVQTIVCDLQPALARAGLSYRVLSYDVRQGHRIPEGPGGRHAVYVGTGGPGHLDPRMNDGLSAGSQGIQEDPAWERPLFALFDSIREDPDAVLLAVCHTFGVICRWLGIAEAVLRGPERGGKSTGVVENVLTPTAIGHPWFSRLSEELPDQRRLRVLDSRLYDLVPTRSLGDVAAIGYETHGVGGPVGDALTMIEVAREGDGVMPRIFAVNHHPEIVNRPWQLALLKKRVESGAVSPEWYAERTASLSEQIDEHGDRALRVTSLYTLLAPLQHHLHRQARRRAAQLGRALALEHLPHPILLARGTGGSPSDDRA
jgi:hypothetical protein